MTYRAETLTTLLQHILKKARIRSKKRPLTRWTDDLKRFTGNWIQRVQAERNGQKWGRLMSSSGHRELSDDVI